MTTADKIINSCAKLGDGRYSYYNENTGRGIGCSDYWRLVHYDAGVITAKERDDVSSLWAIKGYKKVLEDKTRFTKLSPKTTPQKGDTLFYEFHHVSIYSGGNWDIYEAAPESTHGISANGKTGVGLWKNHTYNCSGGSLTNIYRPINREREVTDLIKSEELVSMATDVCLAKYGPTTYINSYPYNVGKWDGTKWSFDCLGFVHTMVNGFKGDRTKLGGGAKMDDFVLNCSEDATLKSCTSYGHFDGTEPCKGELLQSSGHVGIYIGEYKVTRSNGNVDVYNTAECTSAFGGGCMLTFTDVSNGKRYNKKGGTYRSTWSYHGKLSRVEYSNEMPIPTPTETVELSPKEKLQIASDIIDGKYGVNPERKERLTSLFGEENAIKLQNIVTKAYD